MIKFALVVAAVAVMAQAPAYAGGEGRVEARGGIVFTDRASEAFAGIGGGYDFDLGDKLFVGVDLGADKVLARGSDVVLTVGGRIGVKVGEKGRIYANGGMGFCCGGSDPYIGAGYQQKLGSKVYGKIEYRRALTSFGRDINFAGVGVGMSF